jgi:transposase
LTAREVLVRTRSRCICVVRALLRQQGLRVRSGNAETFGVRVAALPVARPWLQVLRPVLATLRALNDQIKHADRKLERLTGTDPRVRRLGTLPGIGPVTAAAFVATLDSATRFKNAHQVEAYLGLVPSEYSSGDHVQRGRLTKRGDGRCRWLLIEAAWRVLRLRHPATEILWTWTEAIARRRGQRIAVVALARRLTGILYAMMRDQVAFDPRRFAVDVPKTV